MPFGVPLSKHPLDAATETLVSTGRASNEPPYIYILCDGKTFHRPCQAELQFSRNKRFSAETIDKRRFIGND
jgi:hypothetical protein